MRNLKTFENWKGDYNHRINDIIDECMQPLEMFNFTRLHIDHYKDFKFICKYEREKTLGFAQVDGYIENGKIYYNQLSSGVKYYSEKDKEFVENEFMSVIEQMASIMKEELGNKQLNFSFSTKPHDDKERIVIFIPNEQNKKSWM